MKNNNGWVLIVLVLSVLGFLAILMNAYFKYDSQYRDRVFQEDIKESNRRRMDACLNDAFKLYDERWEEACKDQKLGKDCRLPSIEANQYDQAYKEDKELCIKKYEN